MITKDNLTQVMDQITENEIKQVMKAKSDYIGLWLSGYGAVNLESVDINNEEQESDILSTGGLITDKDEFLRLFMDSESLNPFIMEYC